MIISASELIQMFSLKDFDEFIIMAIGSHKYLHEDINKVYENNKFKYYEFYKNSNCFHNKSFMSTTTQNYVSIQRFSGIYLYEKSISQNQITMSLIKKGYKYIYNFIKNKQYVNLYVLRNNYLEFVRKNRYAQTVKSSHMFTIALYLCEQLKINIQYDEWDIENMLKPSFKELQDESTGNDLSFNEPKILEYIKKFSNIGMAKKDFYLTLNHFFSAINRKSQEEMFKDGYNPEELKEISEKSPFSKSLKIISRILSVCDVDSLDLQSTSVLDYEKLKLVVQLCIDSVENDELPNIDMDQLFTITLMVYFLALEYNITKNEYLEKANEETIYETFKLREEYEKRLALIEKQEEKTKSEVIKLISSRNDAIKEINTLKNKLKEKEKEVSKLSRRYSELEKQFNELSQVLELYRLPVIEKEKISIEEMVKFISSKKCIVIGGHPNWQGRLQSALLNLRFISADELNKDISFLTNSDAVFYNESVNSHAMFNKAKSALEGNNIPFIYIGRFDNIELTLQAIYTRLKSYLNK